MWSNGIVTMRRERSPSYILNLIYRLSSTISIRRLDGGNRAIVHIIIFPHEVIRRTIWP